MCSGLMAKKSAQKPAAAAPPPAAPPRRMPIIAALIAAIAVGALAYSKPWQSASDREPDASQAASPTPLAPLPGPPANARFGPHKHEMLPPLPFSGFPPARPVDVTTAAYKFAAEHPEVLGYVPCYCGCERSGHRGNDDCFVAERDPNGDVRDWEQHGMT